jgi:ABC-type cobalamin/Fe3+-siderophores transport system ATPase subunit
MIERLSGLERKKIRNYILSAYPTEDELAIFLIEEMDLRYKNIFRGNSYDVRLFNLVNYLESTGRLEDFTELIIRNKPNIPYLQDLRVLIEKNSLKNSLMSPKLEELKNLQIVELELSNIRCFEKLNINLESDKTPIQSAMILGDNAAGKTTLLRSMALGLCNESDATALMRSLNGKILRQDTKEGYIKIKLRDQGLDIISERKSSQQEKSLEYTITTTITKDREGIETVRKEVEPKQDFLWSDIFICGYGASRYNQTYENYEKYQAIDAVQSLFNPQANLQNPEIVLRRRTPEERIQLEERLLNILMLDSQGYRIFYTEQGIALEGPWGLQPFEVMSDGYRSTTQWILDFMSWLIHANRLINNPDIGGILLIDEIEQHLHPRWQRHIVQRLRQKFPKTQIIASTHTPLVASGMADIESGGLLKLEQDEDNHTVVKTIDKKLLHGKRADQILASEAFNLPTTRNLGSQDDIDRYSELLSKIPRSEDEEKEFQKLQSNLQNSLTNEETPAGQRVGKVIQETLEDMTKDITPELIEMELQKQLQSLLHPQEEA